MNISKNKSELTIDEILMMFHKHEIYITRQNL